MKASEVIEELRKLKNDKRGDHNSHFFKTKKGEYGEGDIFWGVKTPEVRKIARRFKDLPNKEIEKLLNHKVHNIRFIALAIMNRKFKKNRKEIYDLYIKNIRGINNWDLVDMSAPHIVGPYLYNCSRNILYKFACSGDLWKQRISIISTFYFIKKGEYQDTLKIAEILLKHHHDLIHKAVGWMLREVGKNCGEKILTGFLDKYGLDMPRTMLRYAIEKFPEKKRLYYLKKK